MPQFEALLKEWLPSFLFIVLIGTACFDYIVEEGSYFKAKLHQFFHIKVLWSTPSACKAVALFVLELYQVRKNSSRLAHFGLGDHISITESQCDKLGEWSFKDMSEPNVKATISCITGNVGSSIFGA